MIGMIKKDLFMIVNNYKSILIAMLIFIFYSIQFDMDMPFFIPFMGLMCCISTINYDDFNNWHTYAVSMPQGKVGVIKSKYITTLGVTIILSLLSIFINFIIQNIKGNFVLSESLAAIVGELCIMIFMMAILFPILFKFGAEKGRIAMILIGFGAFAVIMLISKVIEINVSESFATFFEAYFPIIFILSSIIAITISYNLSKKIYLKREF